jgi:hypothetical protein
MIVRITLTLIRKCSSVGKGVGGQHKHSQMEQSWLFSYSSVPVDVPEKNILIITLGTFAADYISCLHFAVVLLLATCTFPSFASYSHSRHITCIGVRECDDLNE